MKIIPKPLKLALVFIAIALVVCAGYEIYLHAKPYNSERCLEESMVKAEDCCKDCACIEAYSDYDKYDSCLSRHNLK